MRFTSIRKPVELAKRTVWSDKNELRVKQTLLNYSETITMAVLIMSLMMERVNSSQTSVSIYQTRRHYALKAQTSHNCQREILKPTSLLQHATNRLN